MSSSEPDSEPDGFEEEADIFDFEDEAAIAAADARAEADFAAGRVVSNEAVIRWLKAWGAGERPPRPKCGE